MACGTNLVMNVTRAKIYRMEEKKGDKNQKARGRKYKKKKKKREAYSKYISIQSS